LKIINTFGFINLNYELLFNMFPQKPTEIQKKRHTDKEYNGENKYLLIEFQILI